MWRALIVAAAVLAAGCNQAGPAPKAEEQPSADVTPLNAPSQQASAQAESQANITDEDRQRFESLVKEYLDNAQKKLAGGFTPAQGFNDEVTSLQPGHDHRWQVMFAGGTSYRVIGGCDNECSNLDIEIIDARGAVVASDMAPDDFPSVSFRPAAGGQYTIRILMQACTIAPCFAGARVLTEPTI